VLPRRSAVTRGAVGVAAPLAAKSTHGHAAHEAHVGHAGKTIGGDVDPDLCLRTFLLLTGGRCNGYDGSHRDQAGGLETFDGHDALPI
jgi:hypothetical protein